MNHPKVKYTTQILIATVLLILTSGCVNGQVICQIVDQDTVPIPYANVYITSAATGALSDELGRLSLSIASLPDSSTLTVSCLGYQTKNLSINDLKSVSDSTCKIELVASSYTLEDIEVVESAIRYREIKLGVPPPQGANRMGYNNSGRGAERGLLVENEKRCRLDKIDVYISNVEVDSFNMEVNLYKYRSGEIGPKLQRDRLFFTIKSEDNNSAYPIDMSQQQLYIDGPFVVSTTMLDDLKDVTAMLEATPKKKYSGFRHTLNNAWLPSDMAPSILLTMACPEE